MDSTPSRASMRKAKVIVPQANGSGAMLDDVRTHVSEVVVGQEEVVERVLIALFTGGHLLLQGVPGLAKTLIVHAMSKAIELSFARIQFTIDLLPADIVGSEMLDERTGEFYVRKGPVFANLLLADEINRATPKVQAALLEGMQERRVTIGGTTFDLPSPFVVIATQNPIEQSGTFELPEAQLDRFLLCHRLDYPRRDDEADIVRRSLALGLKHAADGDGARPMSAFDAVDERPAALVSDLVGAMQAVLDVHVSEVLLDHCVDLARATRDHPDLDLGCSPRAGIALVQACRARAFIHGRSYATPEDLFALAIDVLAHRMRPSYDAAASGRTSTAIVEDILRDLF